MNTMRTLVVLCSIIALAVAAGAVNTKAGTTKTLTSTSDYASMLAKDAEDVRKQTNIKAANHGLGKAGRAGTVKASEAVKRSQELLKERQSQQTPAALTSRESKTLTKARQRIKDLKSSFNQPPVFRPPTVSAAQPQMKANKSYDALKMVTRQQQKIQEMPVATDNTAVEKANRHEMQMMKEYESLKAKMNSDFTGAGDDATAAVETKVVEEVDLGEAPQTYDELANKNAEIAEKKDELKEKTAEELKAEKEALEQQKKESEKDHKEDIKKLEQDSLPVVQPEEPQAAESSPDKPETKKDDEKSKKEDDKKEKQKPVEDGKAQKIPQEAKVPTAPILPSIAVALIHEMESRVMEPTVTAGTVPEFRYRQAVSKLTTAANAVKEKAQKAALKTAQKTEENAKDALKPREPLGRELSVPAVPLATMEAVNRRIAEPVESQQPMSRYRLRQTVASLNNRAAALEAAKIPHTSFRKWTGNVRGRL